MVGGATGGKGYLATPDRRHVRASRVAEAAQLEAFAVETPGALRAGFRAGLELALPRDDDTLRLYAVGMGASAIPADLARSVATAETTVDMAVVRNAQLPRAVDASAHVLLLSYSGDTWETLHAYDAAARAGARRTVVTSGGRLADRAEEDGVPVLRIPLGLPPRSAFGYLLGGTLGLLDSQFPESNGRRVDAAALHVEHALPALVGPNGAARRLARSIGGRFPFVYASTEFLPVARRWTQQFEENAKRLAACDELPEAMHNALVGWNATSRQEAGRLAVVILEWSREEPIVDRTMRYFERLLRRRGVAALRTTLEPEDRLEALLLGIVLGDLTSLSLAELRHADPLPVDAITKLKSFLSAGR